jgi:hypothetical protein
MNCCQELHADLQMRDACTVRAEHLGDTQKHFALADRDGKRCRSCFVVDVGKQQLSDFHTLEVGVEEELGDHLKMDREEGGDNQFHPLHV